MDENKQMFEMKHNLGKPTAVVFSFDTTASMSPCLAQVRKTLRNLVEQMTQDIPDLKIGLIAHGDYCDGQNKARVLDITNDLELIMNFIANTPATSGGDAPECYELALNLARGLSWPAEGGSLVLIGDNQPHTPDYPMNSDHLDWRQEMAALSERNIKVFPMQCLYNSMNLTENSFWEEISGLSGTPLLILDSFQDAAQTLAAVAYASTGSSEMYDDYVATCDSSPASSNLTDIRNKLRSFVNKTEE